MSLNGLFSLGGGALMAHDAAIAVTGRNTANAGTEGYSRERVDLQSELAAPLVGGVRAGGVQRMEDVRLAHAERTATGASGQSSTLASILGDLEQALTPDSGSLPQSIAQIFARFTEVAANPQDRFLRTAVITDAQQLADAFTDGSEVIAQAQRDSDSRISDLAQQASVLTTQIAAANKALLTSPDPVLADRRDLAARQLAELVGGKARIDSDGKMRFVAASGAVLVDGDRAASVRAVPDAAMGGHVRLEAVDGVHVTDITSQLDGGKLAGEIAFRDTYAAQAASNLDQLAFDLATKFNAVHRANAALDGTTGHDFFVEPTVVAGAARSFAVDAALVANPSLLASASPGTGPGNAGGANAIVALRDALTAGSGTRTFTEQGISIISEVGLATSAANVAHSLDADRLSVLAASRDSLSGVSIEEEMTRLAAFQHAHEAAAKFVSTVDELLGDLIDRL